MTEAGCVDNTPPLCTSKNHTKIVLTLAACDDRQTPLTQPTRRLALPDEMAARTWRGDPRNHNLEEGLMPDVARIAEARGR
jgi:hypothetical protein